MGIEKATKTDYRPPPPPEGWRKVVDRQELDQYFIQDVVWVLRKHGDKLDRKTLVELMGHISKQILNVLRGFVGKNHYNDGRDIIDDVHSQLIRAVLNPDSKDGQALCEAFVPRIRHRARDAIRDERNRVQRYTSAEVVPIDSCAETPQSPIDEVDESLLVDSVLNTIPDLRKRLAFRLYIDGCPIEGENSIALAVDKTPRTVSTWIKETKAQLSAKLGENHD